MGELCPPPPGIGADAGAFAPRPRPPTQLALTVPAQYVQMELNRTMIEPHASAALLGSLARVGSALGATLALSPMWTARRVKHAQQGMLALAVFVTCVHQVRSPMLAKQCV